MTAEETINQENLSETKNETPRKKHFFFRFLGWTMFLLFLILIAGGLALGLWLRHFYQPIKTEDIQEANAMQLAGWTLLRDMEKESPEIREEFAQKCFDLVSDTKFSIDPQDPDTQKLLAQTKEIVEERDEELEKWSESQPWEPPFKKLYTVNEPDHRTMNSSDVSPTQELIDEIKTLRESGKTKVPPAKNRIEANLRVISKNWYIAQMKQYDEASDIQRAQILTDAADRLFRLQTLYNDYRAAAGLESLSDIELLAEANYAVASWYDSSEPEELAKLLWFKDILLVYLVAEKFKQMSDTADLSNILSNAVGKIDKKKGQKLLNGLQKTISVPKEQTPSKDKSLSEDFF